MVVPPTRWALRRLRDVAELRVSNVDKHEKEGEVPVRLCNYVDVYKNERITDHIEFMRATATPEEVERFRLRDGDVLITKDSETWTDIGVPALVEYEASDLVAGYHLALLRPRHGRSIGGFLLRALQSPDVADQLHVAATGVTRYGLSRAAIKSVVVPVPPLTDQAAIARFLDHADRRIRRAIRAKQKLIELLNEQKQVIIHRAVTRGLDPTVRLKPSGSDWLGDVPEHWEVQRLGSLLIERGETNANGSVNDVLSLLRGRGVIPYEEKGNVGNKKSDDITRYKIVRPNDIVINSMNVIIGSVGLSPSTGCLSPVYYVLKHRSDRDDPRYLNMVFQSTMFQRSLVRVGYGILAHRMRIPMRLLKRELLPRPPTAEQMQIVEAIGEMTRTSDRIINCAQREIALLRDFGRRLIADVVTGKLEVRDAAARLPDEGDEAEPLGEAHLEETDDAGVEDLESVEA